MSKKGIECLTEAEKVVSGVFTDRHDHALDSKKRFTIPSEWRSLMGNPKFVYVMPDPREKCLHIIPQAEMEGRLAKLRERALFDPALAPLLQTIGSSSEMPLLDVQGRIRISDKLLQFANLTTTVAMVGSVRTIKLWNPAALAPVGEVDQTALAAALEKAAF